MAPASNSDEATPTTDMDTSTVPGEDIDPSEVTEERGWMVCYRNRSQKRLQALRAEKPSQGTVSPYPIKQGTAKHALRLPPLPREHVKVVFRPQGGLDVSKISAAILRSATLVAAGLTKLQASEDILRPNAARNVFVMSTPSIERAKTYSMVRQLNIENRAYSTLPYVASPEDTCKGVIHGIPPEDTPQDIIDNIVNSTNPQAIHARRMGTTNTALIAFDGPKVPLLIYYGGAEFRCYIHKQKSEACLACGAVGHRADVCPNPTPSRCQGCGQNTSEDNPHSCTPKCPLCKGDHPFGDKSCTQRFKPPSFSSKPSNIQIPRQDGARHPSAPRGKTTPPGFRKQSAAADPPASTEEKPGATRASGPAYGPKHPSQKINNSASAKVSWAEMVAPRTSPPSSYSEVAELKQLLLNTLEENEKLSAKVAELQKQIATLTNANVADTNGPIDSDSNSPMESEVVLASHSLCSPPKEESDCSSIYVTKVEFMAGIEKISKEVKEAMSPSYKPFQAQADLILSKLSALEARLAEIESRPSLKKASKPYNRPSLLDEKDHGAE
ncbi:hypothetical protein HPB48_010011 [Haemaphysalis longicornis]|uniref:CCHC-type domain-containing protein n=1 Tax=Haemaphysalis longicornis TaxID=44386 RepID=A0A9J6GFC3_HAELO|nr:hypothetical protein HPB48_010011 [Haemaphysalis longicornis]